MNSQKGTGASRMMPSKASYTTCNKYKQATCGRHSATAAEQHSMRTRRSHLRGVVATSCESPEP